MVSIQRLSEIEIDEVFDAIEAERKDSTAEIEAWESFRARLDELDRNHSVPSVSQSPGVVRSGYGNTVVGKRAKSLEKVQREIQLAYRETVLSTPTTEELESRPCAHMAAELGGDISDAVYCSTVPPPSMIPMIHRAIDAPIASRKMVIKKCDREEARIERFQSRLDRIQEEFAVYASVYPQVSFTGLIVYSERLRELRDECTEIARERQETLHSTMKPDIPWREFVVYLYQDCEHLHPVLAATVETLGAITRLIEMIDEDIVTRDT